MIDMKSEVSNFTPTNRETLVQCDFKLGNHFFL